MSFNEKVNTSLLEIKDKIEAYDDHQNIDHRKCDYIELLALLNTDELYEDNLLSRFYKETNDRNEVDEDNDLELDFDADTEAESLNPVVDDNNEKNLQTLFKILTYRQSMFEENYPFIVTDDSIKLKNIDDLTKENKIYIILLCCANLKKFHRSVRSKLTEEFEEITFQSISKFLPQFELKRMGSNADYRGSTRAKLRSLANDMNILTDEEQINFIAPTASKEKGVDLFGWKKFKDNIPNMLMVAIQCACGEDSEHKINEPENYHNYLHFSHFKIDPIIVLAVPKSVAIAHKTIKDKNEVMKKNSLYFDRLRLMEYVDNTMQLETLLLADKLIENTISVVD